MLIYNYLFQKWEISDPTDIIFKTSKEQRKDFYRTVARGLQRPLFSVYRRVIRMYDQKNHIGKYSPNEMEQLREYVHLLRFNFNPNQLCVLTNSAPPSGHQRNIFQLGIKPIYSFDCVLGCRIFQEFFHL